MAISFQYESSNVFNYHIYCFDFLNENFLIEFIAIIKKKNEKKLNIHTPSLKCEQKSMCQKRQYRTFFTSIKKC